jgi:prepilin-type N-terminal cleavage/methylation domain-containing protein
MSNKPRAFTLLEVMIALSLSCVVVFGMLQTYRNLMSYLDKVRDILIANRQVCLLFNQMERDFNTAFIPPIYKIIAKEDDNVAKAPEKKTLSKEEQEKEKQLEVEKYKNYFLATYDEQDVRRNEGRSVYPFKSVALINTNPLQVYGQRRVRMVRVMYELKLDKEKSRRDAQCYQLWRKESTDIDNIKMKINEFSAPTEMEKAHPIRTHLVADNIKNFYLEYVFKEKTPDNKSDDKDKKPVEKKRFFSWGDRKETMGIVPAQVDVFIEFWNMQLTHSCAFRTSFMILSYPTNREEAKKDAEKEDISGKDKSAAGPTPGQTLLKQEHQGTPAVKPSDNHVTQAQPLVL